MQVVEGGVGGEGAHDVRAGAGEGVRQGQKLRLRLADGQDAEGALGLLRRGQGTAVLAEGLAAKLELLLGDGHSGQGLQPQGGLGRVQGRGEGEVKTAGRGPCRRANGDHWQMARGACGLEPSRQGQRVLGASRRIDDGDLDFQIAEGGDGRVGAAGGDGAPTQPVQPFGQGAHQGVILGDDEDAGMQAGQQLISSLT